MKKPTHSKHITIGGERDANLLELSDKKWRTGSTGGSSVKDPEIIRSEVKKTSGSPSPSPPSHPQFPLMH